MDDTAYQTPFIEGRRRRSSKKRMIVSIIVVFVLILVGIGGIQFFANSSNSTPSVTPTPMPTTVAFPTDTPTPTASPTAGLTPSPTPKQSSIDTKTKLDRKNLRVMVENGSGVVGAANKTASLLKTVGYVVTGTQNADAFTYEDVTISVKADKAAYLPILKQDLESEYTVGSTNTTLGASSSADAVVIVGK
ncbi:MAG: LytR C-terminal domain-containing protein [Candidatus Levybacteria bacterium]|nr:LytR C-terminal domain-containing protein [Candidatus Levybacteria bacterium]